MKKNKVLLSLVGSLLMCVSGCNKSDRRIRLECDHVYSYKVIDGIYHNQACLKCGKIKEDSKEIHNIDSSTQVCKLCSYSNDVSPSESGLVCSHSWGEKVIIQEPTCTEKGLSQVTCIKCGTKKTATISLTNHNWIEDTSHTISPTCTQSGIMELYCTRCNARKTEALPALDHDLVEDETGGTPPTCESAGKKSMYCKRCSVRIDNIEVPALRHSFSEWTIESGNEPTCETSGVERRICTRCYKEETREISPLGHSYKLISNNSFPGNGKSNLNIYCCLNCFQNFLGFTVNDVTEESRNRLVFSTDDYSGDTGARFWGRPIGNSLALDSKGNSLNMKNNEVVYCSTETGDYFEFNFDLTAEQAALLSSCKLYCDARPAEYLTGDFWAYGASNVDWTPGYYIDGAPEHIEEYVVYDHTRVERDDNTSGYELEEYVPMGKRVENYRYVLYVNGQVRDFDSSISVPVEGSGKSMVRKEYVMPYTFNLIEGQNRISLHMAGGYKATFYNFIFKPC